MNRLRLIIRTLKERPLLAIGGFLFGAGISTVVLLCDR